MKDIRAPGLCHGTRQSSVMKMTMISPLPSDDGDNDHDDNCDSSIIPASSILASGACVPGTVLSALHILTIH